ncbi:MAG: hypothetical protein QOK47_1147, partial [Actinomycetota bacterium]|nr:hypothetical protein [Actinomycetota bacterium]
MIHLDIPDDLALAFAEEPVLDIYAVGPWRIPDGLLDSLRDAAARAVTDPRVADWVAESSESYRRPANGVGETLDLMLGFLLGGCAIRSGFWGQMVMGMTEQFWASPPAPTKPSWDYFRSQDGAWRPPGWVLSAAAGDDPERRKTAFAVLRSLVDVFQGLEPIENRRQALARLIDQRANDPAQQERDLTTSVDALPDVWAQAADADTLAALPELSGPTGYLAWALDGLGAVHRHLQEAVGDGDALNKVVADLMLAVGIQQLPAELAVATGETQF